MSQKLALISVGMNTTLKLEEERIWANWFRGMFGDDVYLINNISTLDNGIEYKKHELIDYSESFPNPGHIPGCCEGLMRGLDHLKWIQHDGPVVLTVCDVIADEGFKDVINVKDFDAEIYTHDWGHDIYATDWIFLTPKIWKSFQFPQQIGFANNSANGGDGTLIALQKTPVMEDHTGRRFMAPDHYPVLEEWNRVYIKEMGWKNKYAIGSETPGWGTNVGTWINISGVKFRIVQSAGDARPSKTHLTNKYMEFDRDYK